MKDIYNDEVYLAQYAPEVALVRGRMGEKRLAHSLGVAHTAWLLAEKYGADPAEAFLAGICHDIAKELPREQMLALLQKSPLADDAGVLQNRQLWHAPAGAVLLAGLQADYPRLTEEVQNACLWHTLGRPEMTLLESLIFVADLIEPRRDFPDLPPIRQAVWQDLDLGICACMQGVIGFLESENNFVHPMAYKAWEYYKNKIDKKEC